MVQRLQILPEYYYGVGSLAAFDHVDDAFMHIVFKPHIVHVFFLIHYNMV